MSSETFQSLQKLIYKLWWSVLLFSVGNLHMNYTPNSFGLINFCTFMQKIPLPCYRPPLAILCCHRKNNSTSKISMHKDRSISCHWVYSQKQRFGNKHISRDLRLPDFLPDRDSGYSSAMCKSANTVICTGQETIQRISSDPQRCKEWFIIAYIKDWW